MKIEQGKGGVISAILPYQVGHIENGKKTFRQKFVVYFTNVYQITLSSIECMFLMF